jgi:hypothetical protein
MEAEINSMTTLMEKINWHKPEVYAAWLSQAYFIANRSTPLLGLCMFHSDKSPDFQKRCFQHMKEEMGHEKLILNDLKNMNKSLQPELASTMGIYQTQYFRITCESPLSFLGYIFLLELLAPVFGPSIINKAAESAPNSLSFLKVHATADEHHIDEAREMLEKTPIEFHQQIFSNFMMSKNAYCNFMTDLANLDVDSFSSRSNALNVQLQSLQ